MGVVLANLAVLTDCLKAGIVVRGTIDDAEHILPYGSNALRLLSPSLALSMAYICRGNEDTACIPGRCVGRRARR